MNQTDDNKLAEIRDWHNRPNSSDPTTVKLDVAWLIEKLEKSEREKKGFIEMCRELRDELLKVKEENSELEKTLEFLGTGPQD